MGDYYSFGTNLFHLTIVGSYCHNSGKATVILFLNFTCCQHSLLHTTFTSMSEIKWFSKFEKKYFPISSLRCTKCWDYILANFKQLGYSNQGPSPLHHSPFYWLFYVWRKKYVTLKSLLLSDRDSDMRLKAESRRIDQRLSRTWKLWRDAKFWQKLKNIWK